MLVCIEGSANLNAIFALTDVKPSKQPIYVLLCVFFREGASKVWNPKWKHLRCHDVISMPDKWEFPWVTDRQFESRIFLSEFALKGVFSCF